MFLLNIILYLITSFIYWDITCITKLTTATIGDRAAIVWIITVSQLLIWLLADIIKTNLKLK